MFHGLYHVNFIVAVVTVVYFRSRNVSTLLMIGVGVVFDEKVVFAAALTAHFFPVGVFSAGCT